MKKVGLVTATLLLLTTHAEALDRGDYNLKKLKRHSINEYVAEIGRKKVRIHTRFCSVWASGAHGILMWRGWSGSKVHIVEESFGEEKVTTCDVDEVWIKVE